MYTMRGYVRLADAVLKSAKKDLRAGGIIGQDARNFVMGNDGYRRIRETWMDIASPYMKNTIDALKRQLLISKSVCGAEHRSAADKYIMENYRTSTCKQLALATEKSTEAVRKWLQRRGLRAKADGKEK